MTILSDQVAAARAEEEEEVPNNPQLPTTAVGVASATPASAASNNVGVSGGDDDKEEHQQHQQQPGGGGDGATTATTADDDDERKDNNKNHRHAVRVVEAAQHRQHDENDEDKSRWYSSSRYNESYPRTYHVLTKVILPLLFLIVLAFLCGYILVLAEAKNEIAQNDAAMANIVDQFTKISELAKAVRTAPKHCLDAYTPSTTIQDEEGNEAMVFNRTELELHMKGCGEWFANATQSIVDEFLATYEVEAYETLTFDWNLCRPNSSAPRDHQSQAKHVVDAWLARYYRYWDEHGGGNIPDEVVYENALEESSGHDDCRYNVAAGSLFFFTVMTTIGYGNTAPATSGGRALLYTLGFVSILIFSAIIGQAAYILLVVVDDVFLRYNKKWLTQGIPAVTFWFAVWVLWLLVIAGVLIGWNNGRGGGQEVDTLSDAVWFAYISVTTVGLGDFYIPHDMFRPEDMFYVPLDFLVGFVLLANFLLKLSDVLVSQILKHRKGKSLEQILEETRSSSDRRSSPEERSDVKKKIFADPTEEQPASASEVFM